MKYLIVTLQIFSLSFISGCSNKSSYEALQRSHQWECQNNPTANCEKGKNYEEYKTEREKLLKKENPIKEIRPENPALLDCPYPGEPVNWALRYCAIEYQTDDEIFLQKSDCFTNALADLHSKKNSCQIKEKYKRLYCKALVEKYRTRESVTVCLEDYSIQPFFAGN